MFNTMRPPVDISFSLAGLQQAIDVHRSFGFVPRLLVLSSWDFWWLLRDGQPLGLFDLLDGIGVLRLVDNTNGTCWALMSAELTYYSEP